MFRNTKDSGKLNFFIYKDVEEDDYIGFCLELGIIKEGEDFEEVRKDLIEASFGYVFAVDKLNMSDELLNQPPPKEYMEIFNEYISSLTEEKPKKKSSFDFATIITEPVGGLCLAA